MRTLWAVTHDSETGWLATEYQPTATGTPDLDKPTERTIGPFPDKPDLETALVKAGIGFMDYKEI